MPSALIVTCASCVGRGGSLAVRAGATATAGGAATSRSRLHAPSASTTSTTRLAVMMTATGRLGRIRIAARHRHAELLRQLRIARCGDATDFARRLDLVFDLAEDVLGVVL